MISDKSKIKELNAKCEELIDATNSEEEKKNSVEEGLEYFLRYCDDKLTDAEKAEVEAINQKNKDKEISDNPYCSCGCFEGEEELSLDTH